MTPEGGEWWSDLKVDGYRAQVALGKGGPKLYTRSGLGGEQFFQNHRTAGLPEGLKPVTITEKGGGKAEYVFVDSAKGLVGAVQMGTKAIDGLHRLLR